MTTEWLISTALFFVTFLIGAIPLHFSVKVIGGKTSILKTIGVNIIIGIILGLGFTTIPFIGIIASALVIFLIYKIFFKIGWLKALLVWGLQISINVLITTIAFILGLSFLLVR